MLRSTNFQALERRALLISLPLVVGGSIVANVLSWDVKWQIPLVFAALYLVLTVVLEIRDNQVEPHSRLYRTSEEFFTALSRLVQSAERRVCVSYVRYSPPGTETSAAAEQYFANCVNWMRSNPGASFYRIIGLPTQEPYRTRILEWLRRHREEMRNIPNYHARVIQFDNLAGAINIAVVDEKSAVLLVTSDGAFMIGHSLEGAESVVAFRDYYNSWWASATPLDDYLH